MPSTDLTSSLSAAAASPFDSSRPIVPVDPLALPLPQPTEWGHSSMTDRPIAAPFEFPSFISGYFTVGSTGQVGIDYLFDGGGYEGEVAIFSLEGIEQFGPGTPDFIREAARRALSGSTEGHVVIRDRTDAARFSGELGEGNHNAGIWKDVQTFTMKAGDRFGVMLAPEGTVNDLWKNPTATGSLRPLFSLVDANPNSGFHLGQIADVDGKGSTFVLEDLRVDGESDRDYNDIIFQVRGAIGKAVSLDEVIPFDTDWRESTLGQTLLEYAAAYDNPRLPQPIRYEFPPANQPLIGIIDTGFSANNPDIDYSRITLGRDRVDNDADPLLAPGTGNEHGTHVIGIIAAEQDNGIGIDGINDQAPLWVGRAIGSGKWAESLTEFVDAARASEQPHAVINLSLDLTQKNPDGSTSTRYEFTPEERRAIEYARQNGVILVVAAGNDGGVMSALGQASQEFDNIITVGAEADLKRADYSSYGYGLDILAPGGTVENPILSTVGNGVGTLAGTSVATAQVTGAISQVWAVNPDLSYRQVIDLVKLTATDLGAPGWDGETGAGLLNTAVAVNMARLTPAQPYNPQPWFTPDIWSGEGVVIPGERPTPGNSVYSGTSVPIPADRGQLVRTAISNGVTIDYYTNGQLLTQPSGFQAWYKIGPGQPVVGFTPLRSYPSEPVFFNVPPGERFRALYNWASSQGFAGGVHNFHQADYGPSNGTILLKQGFFEWEDIPAAELGNPRTPEERFRATYDWATRNGYVGGFPNFHEANYGNGTVYGSILVKASAADWRDIPAAELGNPRTAEERFRATYDWATRNGYVGGFPNFHEADYGNGTVYGTLLIKPQAAEWRDLYSAQLNNPQNFGESFRSANNWASQNGFISAFPNFYQKDYGPVYGSLLINRQAADWRDIPASELGNPRTEEERFRAVYDWATRNGYVGGFPNLHAANNGNGDVYGAVLIKPQFANWRDLSAAELGNPKSAEALFQAVSNWATSNGYVGGFPNLHQANYGSGTAYGAVLLKPGAAEWRDVSQSQASWLFSTNVDTSRDWQASVYTWNRDGGQPPLNFWQNEIDRIGIINLGSNRRGDGKGGIQGDWGQGSPNNDSRLPKDFFVTRAYTIANFEAGKRYKARVTADDGYQLFAKRVGTEEWTYFTPKDQWVVDYGVKEIEFQVPQSGAYDFHFQHYDGGGNAYFDLSWEEVPQTPVSPSPTDTSWDKPLYTYTITSEFGQVRTYTNTQGQTITDVHNAIDLATRGQPPVEAARGGRVVYAGRDSTGYGDFVKIDHGNGIETRYGHLSRIAVRVGDWVTKDTVIGNAGATGNVTGEHLHFEVRENGVAKNPRNFIAF
jgi:murein DD-endopeptidase MepM/ murein hydrolase activator NlpD